MESMIQTAKRTPRKMIYLDKKQYLNTDASRSYTGTECTPTKAKTSEEG